MKTTAATLAILIILTGCVSSPIPVVGTEIFDKQMGTEQASSALKDIRSPSSSIILIAAHRGGYENDKVDQATENSIANISNSVSKGYELYETDIQRTKDGHFVMIHDKTIKRETTGTGKASDMTLAELKQLHKRYRDGSISKDRVATLEEFLQHNKGRTVFKADMKSGVSKYFKGIMALVIKYDSLDKIIFRVRYRAADQFAQYRVDGVPYAKSLLMFRLASKAQIDDIKVRFDPIWIHIDVSKTDPANSATLELIKYATSQGLLVQVQARGDAEDWAKFVEAGARMIHTSSPSKVKAFLLHQEPSATSKRTQDPEQGAEGDAVNRAP